MIKFKLSTILTILLFSISIFAASPGALDSSFGVAGTVKSSFLANSSQNFEIPQAITTQKDGRILIGGQMASQMFIARYQINGQLDASFGVQGLKTLTLAGIVRDIAVQPDNKIVAVGSTFVIRLNSDGSLDTSFDLDGILEVPNYSFTAVRLLADGKIVVGGTNNDDFVVVRLNPNGTTNFGDILSANIEGIDALSDIAIQNDGKIIAVGSSNSSQKSVIVRFNLNGTLDTSFSGDGIVVEDFIVSTSTLEGYSSIRLDDAGKLNVIVKFGTSLVVARYLANGNLDNTFDNDGKFLIPFSVFNFGDLQIQSDGKIVLACASNLVSNTIIPTIYRLNTNGSLDLSFGNNGIAILNDDWGFTNFFVSITESNKLLICSSGFFGLQIVIKRLNLDKTPTITADFDGDGVTDTAVFRPSTGNWFLLRSSDNSFAAFQFGLNGDVPIDGDFDGDGKSDLAIFRPSSGVWFFQRSSDGTTLGATFGISTDKPIPGDYDKDGKTDIAVFRLSTGEWLILRSSTNFSTFFGFPFGQNGDIPISSERK